MLYQAEIREQLPAEALSLLLDEGWSVTLSDQDVASQRPPSPDAVAYATKLIEGVQDHCARIDELINSYAERWAIQRMPIVDKNLLRLGVFELLWMPDVPTAVVINEVVELGKSFSTEESGRFLNGLLGRLAAECRQ